MIAIPNMSKPKDCKECQWHLDFYIEDEQVGGLCTITEKDDRENTCPLIDIVTCGECKKVDTFMCPMFSAGWGYTDEDFCSEGEKRADGDI